MVAVVIVAALVPFCAAALTLCVIIAIIGIVANAVTGRNCLVIERKTTRTSEVGDGEKKRTRTVITTNRNGKITTEVVES